MFYDIEISDELFYEPLNPPMLRRQPACKDLLKLNNFENNDNETLYYSELNINDIIYRSGPDFIYNEEYNKKEYNIIKIKKSYSEYHTTKTKLKSPTIKRFYTY